MSCWLPVKAGSFWTGGATPLALGIRYFCRHGNRPGLAEVNHQGLIFADAVQVRVIHEALFSEGYCEKPAAKLAQFAAASTHHRVIIGWYPLRPETAAALYLASKGLLGKRSYAADQIVGFMLCKSLVGRALNLQLGDDEKRVVCSEVASRLSWESCMIDLRERPGEAFDNVSPQEALDKWRELGLENLRGEPWA